MFSTVDEVIKSLKAQAEDIEQIDSESVEAEALRVAAGLLQNMTKAGQDAEGRGAQAMNPQMEYLRDSGYALAKELLDAAGTGMLAPRIEGIMCQAAAYIVQNEGILERVQESLYLIEERLGMSMEQDITPEEMEKALEGLGEQAQGDPAT